MKNIVRTIVLLLLLPVVGMADGYHQRGAYFYYGDSPQAYYRSLITTQGYWSYGVYYPGYSYYKYYAYTPPTTYTPPVAADWRAQALQYAIKRDKEILEQNHYMETIKALNLQNNRYPAPSYGVPGQYLQQIDGYYQSTYTTNPVNASTTYGYNAYSQTSNDMLAQLYQMANQHTINAQASGDKAATNFQALVGQEGNSRFKVAEVLAKGQIVSAIMKSLEGPPSALTQGYSYRITPQGIQTDNSKVDPGTKASIAAQFKAMADAKCLACHSGATKKGGFDVTVYSSMSPEAKQIVWDRLTTNDQSKLMPRNAKNEPGQRLSPEELRLFALN